ncbi:MAG: ferredoxin--NADP reductase [Gammaproteobacteria bacterium]|nr:ferredoxin--NADP reductase [Gammaproteobacteria bacterium]
MSELIKERITEVHHWNDRLFSFKTTRDPSFRFKSGQFTMIGLESEGRPLLRAYSIASANYDDELEFFSIKVPNGPLTSRLQNVKPGEELILGKKALGTLILDRLLPGKNLYLLSTGTGLAPFLSLIKDVELYEQYEKVILVHGCRFISELAYQKTITETLPNDAFLGNLAREKLIYYPTVTREPFVHQGRITHLMQDGRLFADIALPKPTLDNDRFMICGSPAMTQELAQLLKGWGFTEARGGKQGHFVTERAFVEKIQKH